MHTIEPEFAVDEKSEKLYEMIRNYKMPKDDEIMLEICRSKTCDEIEVKFKQSQINQNFRFPAKQDLDNLSDNDSEISDLDNHEQIKQDFVCLYLQNKDVRESEEGNLYFSYLQEHVQEKQELYQLVYDQYSIDLQNNENYNNYSSRSFQNSHQGDLQQFRQQYENTNIDPQVLENLSSFIQESQIEAYQNALMQKDPELLKKYQNELKQQKQKFQQQHNIQQINCEPEHDIDNDNDEVIVFGQNISNRTKEKLFLNFYKDKVKITNEQISQDQVQQLMQDYEISSKRSKKVIQNTEVDQIDTEKNYDTPQNNQNLDKKQYQDETEKYIMQLKKEQQIERQEKQKLLDQQHKLKLQIQENQIRNEQIKSNKQIHNTEVDQDQIYSPIQTQNILPNNKIYSNNNLNLNNHHLTQNDQINDNQNMQSSNSNNVSPKKLRLQLQQQQYQKDLPPNKK